MDCLIILGGGLDEQQQLNQQSRLRYDKGLKIHHQFDHIVCCSGFTYRKNHLPSAISEAEAGRRYLLQQGVPEEKIISEALSKDTLSNAFHCRKIIDGMGLKEITIITSAFHMKRSIFLFDLVFPKDTYRLSYVKSRNGLDAASLRNRKIHEKMVLDFFKKHLFTTYGVVAGDMNSIGHYLENYHLATSGKMDVYQQQLTEEIQKRMDKKGKLFY
ncbi:MAG: YdcF family protein [Nanoarchaeota archaeon]|nr:YdcF family protein [Nanoarchaeota archaeon]